MKSLFDIRSYSLYIAFTVKYLNYAALIDVICLRHNKVTAATMSNSEDGFSSSESESGDSDLETEIGSDNEDDYDGNGNEEHDDVPVFQPWIRVFPPEEENRQQNFNVNPGPRGLPEPTARPLAYFLLFLTAEFLGKIVTETNR